MSSFLNKHSPSVPPSNDPRRNSVCDATRAFTSQLHNTMDSLNDIWDTCGMADEDRGARMTSVYQHLNEMLAQMVTEECQMLADLKSLCAKRLRHVRALRVELSMDPYLVDENAGFIQLAHSLSYEINTLESLKSERLRRMEKLKCLEQDLCFRLNMHPLLIGDEAIPSADELISLEEHVNHLKQEYDQRLDTFRRLKQQIMSMYKKMDCRIHSDFEKAVLLQSEQHFAFSTSNMDALMNLMHETKVAYGIHKDRIRPLVLEAESQLDGLLDMCSVPDTEKAKIPAMDDDNLSDLLLSYRRAIVKWTRYYERKQNVLVRIDNWCKLWEEKQEFVKKENDPNRYKNRAGNLEQELKRCRKLDQSLLPRAMAEVEKVTAQYMEQHPLEPIMVWGMEPMKFIERKQEEYYRMKDVEKKEKSVKKTKQMAIETRFGTPTRSDRNGEQMGHGHFSHEKPSDFHRSTPNLRFRVNSLRSPAKIDQHHRTLPSPLKYGSKIPRKV